ncbi:MAG: 16S rRNA (uracil(1498)-N(3))-methyltransferase [Thiotrichales bacterium]|jgi:16S rRNA (uracil1498-N3)-methyltransferase|nr:16S rRNA (uracil(1498)-N(3))-methyltransferase [Thiotrichales bacterium]MBT4652980.1 16S rRNA (uracil(1498)-N(3))-methyltransferase [Thiotrichales bacterium]MBT7934373.1 16S rRNA (uracil(1498)-N(3))-methyltransferase [Thiotrichales bacterium]
MKTIRLYQNAPFTEGKTAELDSDNSHHLNKVLRFPVGQNITLFNGDGFDYTAVVQSAKKTTNLKVISKKVNNNESKLNLTLAQGIAKGEKMDFLIQKAVELGVTRIIPMKLERCVVRLRDEKVQKKIDHWQKIANHACEQSGRSVIVDVSHPASLEELLEVTNHNGFVLHHRATLGLSQVKETSKATILIGPEGGLTEKEVNDSEVAGYQSIIIGKRVLRTETASLAAIANMQLLWGS